MTTRRLLLLLGFVITLAPSIAGAAPGDLDPTFGNNGIVVTDFGGSDVAAAVAIQPDGKIVVAGRTNAGGNATFALARYNSGGTLDSTFGSLGLVTTDFGSTDQAFAVAVQPDGKIVTAGRRGSDVIVARHLADGTLDTGFGSGGRTLTNFGATEQAVALALQPDGKIVVAGRTNQGGNFNFAIVRYQSSGALDPSFGGTGIVTTDFGGAVDRAFALALQPDGKLVVAGDSDANFALVRYNANGSVDTSFGGTGKVITSFGGADRASSVVVQPDGKIIAAGQTDNGLSLDFALARYNADGTLDASFGDGGRVTTNFSGNSDDIIESIVLQFDGKIVVGGSSEGKFALARYNTGGSLDTSFGTQGLVTTTLSGDDAIHALAIQADGLIVAVGGANDQFALARYQAFRPVSVQLRLNSSQTVFFPGDTVRMDLVVENEGIAKAVDAIFVSIPPPSAQGAFNCPAHDGLLFFGPGFTPVPGCVSADPSTFPRLVTQAVVPAGLASTVVPGFFSMPIAVGTQFGVYTFVIALFDPGTFNLVAASALDVIIGP